MSCIPHTWPSWAEFGSIRHPIYSVHNRCHSNGLSVGSAYILAVSWSSCHLWLMLFLSWRICKHCMNAPKLVSQDIFNEFQHSSHASIFELTASFNLTFVMPHSRLNLAFFKSYIVKNKTAHAQTSKMVCNSHPSRFLQHWILTGSIAVLRRVRTLSWQRPHIWPLDKSRQTLAIMLKDLLYARDQQWSGRALLETSMMLLVPGEAFPDLEKIVSLKLCFAL